MKESNLNTSLYLSTAVLIAANVIIIVLAVAQHWSPATVFWMYWSQSVIIGIFAFIRIMLAGMRERAKPASFWMAFFMGGFFLIHYGFFHAVYAVFLYQNFPDIQFEYLKTGILIFAINHFLSFLNHSRDAKEQKPDVGEIMMRPYLRILPIHLTIIFFGTFIQSTSALVMFFLTKTFFDAVAHIFEHRAGNK